MEPPPLGLLSLNDDVLAALCGFLRAREVCALASACRELRAVLATGAAADVSVWGPQARRHGAPDPLRLPPGRRTWREHLARDLFARTLAPLRGVASVYGPGYFCIVESVLLDRAGVTVGIFESGDGRMGPIQPWRASQLAVTLIFSAGAATTTVRTAEHAELSVDTANAAVGCLHFRVPWQRGEARPRTVTGLSVRFTYGQVGYGQCTLLDWGRGELERRQLAHTLLGTPG